MTSTIGRHRGAASAKTDDGLDGGTANDTDHGLSGERESVPSADFVPRRLVDILRLLPESELRALISRMGIKIDAAKRIDPPSQVARVLVGLPDVRDPIRLPTASRELLQRIAEAGGSLIVPSLPAGLEALVGRGVVYARKSGRGIELVLPIAFLVQLQRSTVPLAQRVDGQVVGNAMKPCRNARIGLIGGGLLPGTQEHFLGDLFSLGVVADQAEAVGEYGL